MARPCPLGPAPPGWPRCPPRSPRPPLPRAGPGAPLTMAAELLVRPPACAAPRPEKEGLVTRSSLRLCPSAFWQPLLPRRPVNPRHPARVRDRALVPVPVSIQVSSSPPPPSRALRAPSSRSVPSQIRGLYSGGGIQRDASPSPRRHRVAPAGGRFDCGGRRWRRSGGAGQAAA